MTPEESGQMGATIGGLAQIIAELNRLDARLKLVEHFVAMRSPLGPIADDTKAVDVEGIVDAAIAAAKPQGET